MPPAPPDGSFDARFESPEGGTMVQTHPGEAGDTIELPISIQTNSYPVGVTWKINGRSATYTLCAGENVVQVLSGEGTLRLSGAEAKRVILHVTGRSNGLPLEYLLLQNYPNPFNPATTIKFSIPSERGSARGQHVTLKVFDLLGREVATLVNDLKKPGEYSITWDARQTAGGLASALASGVYLYQLRAGSFVQTRKLVLLR
jgi:hypothetical protein